jgi:hypothetical protein
MTMSERFAAILKSGASFQWPDWKHWKVLCLQQTEITSQIPVIFQRHWKDQSAQRVSGGRISSGKVSIFQSPPL